MMRRRFWCLYAAAWLPYALSYYLLFRSMAYVPHPLEQTAYNIVPAAGLGVLLLPWSRVFPWDWHRRWWFYPGQVGAALVYSGLWYVGVLLAGSAGEALATGHFQLIFFRSYALQWQFFSGLMLYGNVVGIAYVLQANVSLEQERRRREMAEALQTSAELAALRAQLNPHFLFNALNSMMALAGPEQPRTMQAIAQLAGMLRYTLQQNAEKEGVRLRQELNFTEQYLALEALRLGGRLRVRREIEAGALGCRVPPFTLQPLVENAIRHGISPRVAGGSLTLRAGVEDGALWLEIEDDGEGADAAAMDAAAGIGLRVVRQRLDLFSGGMARVVVRCAIGEGCRIRIVLPQEREEGRAREEHGELVRA